MKNPLLVSQSKRYAKTLIAELTEKVRRTNQIIQKYNSINGLRPILTKEDAAEFVKSPIKFLDDSIRRDFYIRIDGVKNPDITAVAMIFSIPYTDISSDIRITRPDLLEWDYLRFNESSMTIEVKAGAFNKIKEDSIDAEEVDLCKSLNRRIAKKKLSPESVRAISQILGLGLEWKPDR
jgi:hypothetical protein